MSVLCFGGSRLTYWCVVGAFVALETGFGWTFDWYVPSTVFIGAKNHIQGQVTVLLRDKDAVLILPNTRGTCRVVGGLRHKLTVNDRALALSTKASLNNNTQLMSRRSMLISHNYARVPQHMCRNNCNACIGSFLVPQLRLRMSPHLHPLLKESQLVQQASPLVCGTHMGRALWLQEHDTCNLVALIRYKTRINIILRHHQTHMQLELTPVDRAFLCLTRRHGFLPAALHNRDTLSHLLHRT